MQMILEKMDEFFNSRLEGYEGHQLNAIEGAKEFYPFTASLLPMHRCAKVLDLGCGTGLELGYYFELNPSAKVTGIDIAVDMLKVLKEKFTDKAVTVIQGSYFDVPFEKNYYDAVVSVGSLHHFTKEGKVSLYKKVFKALVNGGYYILTDYFSKTEDDEVYFRNELLRLKTEQGISDNEFYHFDTPLTVEHEIEALKEAGFTHITKLKQWGATCTIKAVKKIIMIHKMNLAPSPFSAISSGRKTIEMRIYDEKRSKIKVGDEIEFDNIDTHQTIKCKVINLTRYKDFFELYSNFDKTVLGYSENETANAEDMYTYYSPEQIEKYGVLAIEIKLIKDNS